MTVHRPRLAQCYCYRCPEPPRSIALAARCMPISAPSGPAAKEDVKAKRLKHRTKPTAQRKTLTTSSCNRVNPEQVDSKHIFTCHACPRNDFLKYFLRLMLGRDRSPHRPASTRRHRLRSAGLGRTLTLRPPESDAQEFISSCPRAHGIQPVKSSCLTCQNWGGRKINFPSTLLSSSGWSKWPKLLRTDIWGSPKHMRPVDILAVKVYMPLGAKGGWLVGLQVAGWQFTWRWKSKCLVNEMFAGLSLSMGHRGLIQIKLRSSVVTAPFLELVLFKFF